MKRKLIEDFDREDFKVARFDESVHSQPVYNALHNSTPVVNNKEATEIDLSTVMKNFVNIYEKLDTSDEAMVKPNYSYTELVYLALLRSPNFSLPIGEIYKYVQNKFTFFRNNARLHWKNAIRHSLSKTKCFTKINLGRGVTGTSNRSCFLWSIDPCSIINFARGDYRPSVDRNSGTNTLRWGYYHTNAGDFWDQVATVLEDKIKWFNATISNCSAPSKVFQQQTCDLPNQSSIANLFHQNVTTSSPATPVCQSPIYNHQSTPHNVPSATPPPNVVCQPNGAFCSSSTPVLYSSSTPVIYQPYKQVDSSPISTTTTSHHNQFLPDTSSVSSSYNQSCSRLTPSTCTSDLDLSSPCFEAASPLPQSSCSPNYQLNPSATPTWSPVSVTPDSGFSKDSGLELSSSDLQSLRDSIPDWMCQSVTTDDSKSTFQSCGSQVDSASYQSQDTSQEESVELPTFPDYVADGEALNLSTIPKSAGLLPSAVYSPYMYSMVPQYNFSLYSPVANYPVDLSDLSSSY